MDYNNGFELIIRDLVRKYRINKVYKYRGIGIIKNIDMLYDDVAWYERRHGIPYGERMSVHKLRLLRECIA